MKKLLIAALILSSAPTTAYASNAGGRTWDLCPTEFPGLGFLGHVFYLPCRVQQTPSNA